jgi:hypothetical protein
MIWQWHYTTLIINVRTRSIQNLLPVSFCLTTAFERHWYSYKYIWFFNHPLNWIFSQCIQSYLSFRVVDALFGFLFSNHFSQKALSPTQQEIWWVFCFIWVSKWKRKIKIPITWTNLVFVQLNTFICFFIDLTDSPISLYRHTILIPLLCLLHPSLLS